MAYTGEEVETFAATLDALPTLDKSKRTYNKKETVRLIKKHITAARTRGYSLEQIADSLRGKGFHIANPTLRNYMSQNQRPVKKKPAGTTSAVRKMTAATAGTDTGKKTLDDFDFPKKI